MTQDPDETQPKAGYIPKPPSQADLDQVSQDQALITDEWGDGGEAGAGSAPDPASAPADPAPPGSAAR